MPELIEVPGFNVDAMVSLAKDQLKTSDAAIADMKLKYMPLVVKGIDDADGLRAVSTARKTVKATRIAIEKKRKSLKSDSLKFGREVDDEAKRIFAEIEPIEAHLIEQESIVQREKDRIAEEAEQARRLKHQQRIDRLNEKRCRVEPTVFEFMADDAFESYAAELESEAAEEKKAQEAEQKRLDAERAELEAERERMRLEREEEQRRLDAERAEITKQQEEERARLQAEREKEDAERRRVEEAERKEREEEQAELARLKQIESDRIAAEEAEKKRVAAEQAEASRLKREAELKPIREQLQVFAVRVAGFDIPDVLLPHSRDIRAILDEAGYKIADLLG